VTALCLEDVCVVRGGRTVVRDVTMDAPLGQVTGLLGPNGAGKSSLALALSGLLRASGSIRLGGQRIDHRSPDRVRAAGVAVVPEGRRLLPDLSVADNLVAATYGRPKNELTAANDRTRELFPELGRLWQRPAKSLSGGEQQMVVLAMALAARPQVLVIDELSLGLAPIIVNRLVPTIRRVADEGVGVLLIEQFAHVVLGLATDVYILEGSRLRFRGTAAELSAQTELLHAAYLLGNAGAPA